MSLYKLPNATNSSDIGSLINQTLSNICIDVDKPFTCGAWIFWDLFLVVFLLVLFSTFRRKSSFKDSYAGASTITCFIAIIIFIMPYNFVRDLELIIVIINMFISLIVLFVYKE